MRRIGGLIVCGFCLLSSGCAVMNIGRDMLDATVAMFRPDTRDYADPVDDPEWSVAGQEGRGDRPMDHESDGWTNIFSSPKRQGIERNLGVD